MIELLLLRVQRPKDIIVHAWVSYVPQLTTIRVVHLLVCYLHSCDCTTR